MSSADGGTRWARDRPERVDRFLGFTGGTRVQTQVGLDGIRGAAVISVVLYHLGYVAGGGQLVSLFFTLSGFLITTLILQEYGTTGRFRLGPFWAARARRILPPAWLTLAAVGVLRVTTTALDRSADADIVATLFHVSNWYLGSPDVFLAGVVGTRTSDLNHTWSLSIEEQFYVALALTAGVALVVARRPATALRTMAIVGAAISFALPMVFGMDHNRTFFGTDTRAGELLIGVAMATIVVARPVRDALLRHRRTVEVAGAAALAAALVLVVTLAPDTRLLENGLLPLGTALWVCVILGAMLPDGPVSWLMHRRLLLWLGHRSYGIYLFHVPVLAIGMHHLPERTVMRAVLLIGITLIVASLSFRFIEMPIRRRRWPRPALAGAAGVALGTIAVSIGLT